MRRHSGAAGCFEVILPRGGSKNRSGLNRRGSKKQGGSERGRSERGGSGRGRSEQGERDTPCGSHPSSSRAATMASKAHSVSLDFPVSAAATSAFPALNQWARFKYPGGRSMIRACWASWSLTIFRNGPLFGAIAKVKGLSQLSICMPAGPAWRTPFLACTVTAD